MRVWDVDPAKLCRQHLLGEHREIHALFKIILESRTGYRHHPETKRWVGKLPALKLRHDRVVGEMKYRGYAHRTPLPEVEGELEQLEYVDPPEEQEKMLQRKDCPCLIKPSE